MWLLLLSVLFISHWLQKSFFEWCDNISPWPIPLNVATSYLLSCYRLDCTFFECVCSTFDWVIKDCRSDDYGWEWLCKGCKSVVYGWEWLSKGCRSVVYGWEWLCNRVIYSVTMWLFYDYVEECNNLNICSEWILQ